MMNSMSKKKKKKGNDDGDMNDVHDRDDHSKSTTRTREGKSEHPFDLAIKVHIRDALRARVRLIAPDDLRSWVTHVASSEYYVPFRRKSQYEDELRMRIIGAACGTGRDIILVDVELGHVLAKIDTRFTIQAMVMSCPQESAKYSPLIAVGSHNGHVKIFDTLSGDQLYQGVSGHCHGAPIKAIAIQEGSPTFLYVAAGSNLIIWDFETANIVKTISDHTKEITVVTLVDKPTPSLFVRAGTWFVTACMNGSVHIYDGTDLNVVLMKAHHHETPILCSASYTSSKTALLITGGLDGYIHVLNVKTTSMVHSLQHPDRESIHCVDTIRFTHNPGLVSGGPSGKIFMWDLISGDLLGSFQAHNGIIKSLKTVLDPKFFVLSGSLDSTAKIWDMQIHDNPEVGQYIATMRQREHLVHERHSKIKRGGFSFRSQGKGDDWSSQVKEDQAKDGSDGHHTQHSKQHQQQQHKLESDIDTKVDDELLDIDEIEIVDDEYDSEIEQDNVSLLSEDAS